MKNSNSPETCNKLANFFQALSDPIRLDIVACLLEVKERRIKTDCYAISKSTLSHHIKILKDVGLIKVKKEGVTHIYYLDREEINQQYPGILDLLTLKLVTQENQPYV
ncbi:ArsR/SmtB family transcription factor [Carnobacterium gallinarum]|uniref:ArsR/SmtB family transcription factor n=1 Tax=Carnobacterium gallinarum TaxID=2749 RepID=UPI00068EACBA|nr:metalloregulator ArsR/SmtB family transcription factor [Carnobacterium gallinarum]